MRKHTQRILAGVAAFALVAAFGLFGCGNSGGGQSQDQGSAPVQSSAAVEASAPVETSAAVEPAAEVQLQIFAANSLSKALAEVQELYTSQFPNVTFADTQYKSSGELNSMLEGGAYADIEITASKGTMDKAEEAGYIDPATRVTMFKNDLVMVTAANNDAINELTLDDIATGNYVVCVGDDSVPAGNYANQSLSTVGCFNDPEGNVGADSAGKAEGTDAYAGTPLEGKVVTDTSVGNVCKHAEAGDVDVAFVYTSDVERFGGVKVVGTVPADTHKNITYPGAVCAQSQYPTESAAFIEWCLSDPNAQEIWQKWGFELA